MLPPWMSAFFLHMALRCEQCLSVCLAGNICWTALFFLRPFSGLGCLNVAEKGREVAGEDGGGFVIVILENGGFTT